MGNDVRIRLHTVLKNILGSSSVYYQSPGKQLMTYPAIIYKDDFDSIRRADNRIYNKHYGYQIILIQDDPDSDLKDIILDNFTHIRQSGKRTVIDNLYHDYFILYYK